MKIAIIGGTGKVANALDKQYSTREDVEVHFFSRRMFDTINDITKIDNLDKKELKDAIYGYKPDIVINTVAYNDVDGAEENHSEAMILNAHLPEFLATCSKVIDAHFISYGTDYIFDGKDGLYKEDALPRPLNYYGKSKLTGENMALVSWERTTIIRTNVVYGPNPHGHNDFIRWVADMLSMEEEINIVNGQYGNPAYTGDIAFVTDKIASKSLYGIYNTGSSDYLNRYEMALIIAEVYRNDPALIKEVSPKSFKQKAKRPQRGGLDLFKTQSELGFEFSSFRDGVEATKFGEKI